MTKRKFLLSLFRIERILDKMKIAIDLNPRVNPYVKGSMISPQNGKLYKERNVSKCKGKYKKNMIQKNDSVYKILKKRFSMGWRMEIL